MLIEFRLANHRSIREEQGLTFEVGAVDAHAKCVREAAGKKLLPVLAIYGANASGKSNVLSALGFMRDAVMESQRGWSAQGGVPRDAFAWGDGPRAPSSFEATFEIQGRRFEYGFVIDAFAVLEEWLFAWPKHRKQVWFERDGQNFSFGEHLHGENRTIEKLTRKNSLFLSAATQNAHPQLVPIYEWFQRIRTVRVEGYLDRYADAAPAPIAAAMLAAATAAAAASAMPFVRLRDLLPIGKDSEPRGPALHQKHIARLGDLLRAADVGIADLRFERHSEGRDVEAPELALRYQHATKDPLAGSVGSSTDERGARALRQDGWLPLEDASAGTRALVSLAPHVFAALEKGSLLVIDELEASLHPLIAARIVALFNDPAQNTRNAQLLFATHDANLLGTTAGPALLRRDQVWLTEKRTDGSTALYPLTDYRPRNQENLERGYLQGRYGAIPVIGRIAPLDEE